MSTSYLFKTLDVNNPLMSWKYHNIITNLHEPAWLHNLKATKALEKAKVSLTKVVNFQLYHFYNHINLLKNLCKVIMLYEQNKIIQVDIAKFKKGLILPEHSDPTEYAVIYPITPTLKITFKYCNNIKYTHTNNVIFFNCNTIHSIEEISQDCCYLRLGVLNTNGIK